MRETQIRTPGDFIIPYPKCQTSLKQTTTNAEGNMRNMEPSLIVSGIANWHGHYKTQCCSFSKPPK